jgi:DedD protein
LALTSSSDDGFREIQLNGKQLVFLFMAVTVVLVVTFLTGVLVGRGVRAERLNEQAIAAGDESPEPPDRSAANIVPAPGNDPTKAAPPPAGAEGEADASAKPASPSDEAPPVAVTRTNPADNPSVPAAPAKAATPAPAKPAPAAEAPSRSAAAAPPAAAPKPTPPVTTTPAPKPSAPGPTTGTAPTTTAADTVRNGYAVQVAAVNAQSEADSIMNRLKAKGYQAYVELPKGSQKMFRVRVGTFKSRSEALTVADKLKKEEKFKPWVTR